MLCWIRRCTSVLVVSSVLVALTPGVADAAIVGPPTGLDVASGNLQVTLSWTAPSVGVNPAVSDYVVEYSSDNGVTWLTFLHAASVATSSTVTSLTNAVSYRFRVAAVNSDGIGPYSVGVSATPMPNHTRNDLATFLACPAGVAPLSGFSDHTSTDVDCIKYYGITKGTTATTYSPLEFVSRWQMALFLTRMAGPAGVTLGSGVDQGFTDILGKSSEIQTAINQIKQLGITVGKTATTFAPDDNVTREEMALFLDRFLKNATVGSGGNTEYVSGSSGPTEIKSIDSDHNFTDLTGVTLYESLTAIANLWNLGVLTASSGYLFEPQTELMRKTMATWITSALAHTNARPSGLVLQASTYRIGGTPQISLAVSHRTSDFEPVSGTMVDTFRYAHSISTTVTRFSTAGACTCYVVVTTVGSTKCTVDAADPVTDSSGNTPIFLEDLPTIKNNDFWAWTAANGTTYDDDLHAAEASKITVETTAGA